MNLSDSVFPAVHPDRLVSSRTAADKRDNVRVFIYWISVSVVPKLTYGDRQLTVLPFCQPVHSSRERDPLKREVVAVALFFAPVEKVVFFKVKVEFRFELRKKPLFIWAGVDLISNQTLHWFHAEIALQVADDVAAVNHASVDPSGQWVSLREAIQRLPHRRTLSL